MTDAPCSTPSWMTGPRRRRPGGRREYGRRRRDSLAAGGGGGSAVRPGGAAVGAGGAPANRPLLPPSSVLLGSPPPSAVRRTEFDFDATGVAGEDEGGDAVPSLDGSAHARLQGRGRAGTGTGGGGRRRLLRPPRAAAASDFLDPRLDQSAHARLEGAFPRRARAGGGGGGGAMGRLDLGDEFGRCAVDVAEDGDAASSTATMKSSASSSRPKKKRPNLPRPPAAAAGTARSSSFAAAAEDGAAKAPSAASAATPFEENVHPNDASGTSAAAAAPPAPSGGPGPGLGARRSSRLEKKARRNDGAAAAASSRPRTRSRSNKRSFASASSDRLAASDRPVARSAASSSSSSSSSPPLTSPFSSGVASGSGSGGAESFSSLARRGSSSCIGWGGTGSGRHRRSASAASWCPSGVGADSRDDAGCGGGGGGSEGGVVGLFQTPSVPSLASPSSSTRGRPVLGAGRDDEGGWGSPAPDGAGIGATTSSSSTAAAASPPSSRKRRTAEPPSSPASSDEDVAASATPGRCGGPAEREDDVDYRRRDSPARRRSRAAPPLLHPPSPPPPLGGKGDRLGGGFGALSSVVAAPWGSPPQTTTGVLPSPSPVATFGRSFGGMRLVADAGVDETGVDVRDRLSSSSDEDDEEGCDDASMLSASDGSDPSRSRDEEEDGDDDEDDDGPPRPVTDAEIFASKPSHEDLTFLARSLQKWSRGVHGRGRRRLGTATSSSTSATIVTASMGLRGGCLVAVPPGWAFARRAEFARWATASFGFRTGSVGGAGCGSFLRCGDAEGRAALERLRRILNQRAGEGGAPSTGRSSEVSPAAAGGTGSPFPSVGRYGGSGGRKARPGGAGPRAWPKLPRLSSGRRNSNSSRRRPPTMSPFCDNFVGDLIADHMRSVTLDDDRPAEGRPSGGCGPSVPHFIRSMTLQPLAGRIRNAALPRICRHGSPAAEGDNDVSGTRAVAERPPRPSSEGAIAGSDFLSQLHGEGSPGLSPLDPGPSLRLRSRGAVGRVLLRPAARRPSPSFGSMPRQQLQQQQQENDEEEGDRRASLRPFESPHPRGAPLSLETPIPSLEFGLETPMPKSTDWDWGVSVRCCDDVIENCNQIFAKAWFTSDFYGSAELSSEFQMSLEKEDEAYLFAFYDADANSDDDDEEEDEDNDSEVASINGSPTEAQYKKIGFVRCDSVGASALDLLHLDDKASELGPLPDRERRRTMKLRKYARMSLCAAAAEPPLQTKSCYRLSSSPSRRPSAPPETSAHAIDSTVLARVLSFLNEGELLQGVSLVCTQWADAAAEALGGLMLASVGCDLTAGSVATEFDDAALLDEADGSDALIISAHSSIAKSMSKGWPYLMNRFPWAQFLADGAFKRVYKVWNSRCKAYEALSVMDVDMIDELGNRSLVGSELAVSVLLSSLARRQICPNFVITRGVFTCQHEPPALLWGSRDLAAPCGTSFDGHARSPWEPQPDNCGNYQYIRMELCTHGDMETFIRNHPEKMLAPSDCRNLLFQMAFALHVAGDRYGLKHYDVKLLNFLMQSARDSTIAESDHPHVVLRYGLGSRVFRLRMHPSSAHVAKLADYGTSVMRTDTDGHPVSIGQFTTLENSPPEFLILGNCARQGFGHDCFGLGLCMLHLFTGHGPYEEILDQVHCPENLKAKLRKIWKERSYDVIRSVMLDCDEDGREVEDETLYDTLYRFLVLFGIPEKCMQFGLEKHGKVWYAINSTLLPPKRLRSQKCSDVDAFVQDRAKFSLANGTDERIANARRRLEGMDGAMELLLSLVSFDPKARATPLDVINSRFMVDLTEDSSTLYDREDMVKSYTAYLTNGAPSNLVQEDGGYLVPPLN